MVRVTLVLVLVVSSLGLGAVQALADPADTAYARGLHETEQESLKKALIAQVKEHMNSKLHTGHQWNKFMSAGDPTKFVKMIQQVDNITVDANVTDRYVTSYWGTDEISLRSDPRKGGGGNPETVLHELLHRIQYVSGDDKYLADRPGLEFVGPDNTLQKQYDERYTDYLEAIRGKFIYLNALEKAATDGASVADLKTKWERFEAEYAAAINASRKYFGIDPKLMRAWCGLWFPDPTTITAEYLDAKLPSGKGWANLKAMLRAQKAANKYTVQLMSLPGGYQLMGGAYVPRNVTGSGPYVFEYTKEPWPTGMYGGSVDQEAYLGIEKLDPWVAGSVTVLYRKGAKFAHEAGYSYSSTLIDGISAETATTRGGGVSGAAEGDVTTSILLTLPSGDGVSIRVGARSVLDHADGDNYIEAAQSRAAPLNTALVNGIRVKKGTSAASAPISVSAADSGVRSLAVAGALRSAPDVQGDMIVWEEYANNSWDIWAQRLSGGGPMRLSSRAGDQRAPRVSGGTIVWYEEFGTNADVWAYDIASGLALQITNEAAPQYEPLIDWNRMVWSDYRDGNWDVYTRDSNNGEIKSIVTEKHPQRHPQIAQIPGSSLVEQNVTYRIIWRDERAGKADIYLHDMSTGQTKRLTTISANENDPVIDGNIVAWKDTRNGLRGDIYFMDVTTGKTKAVTNDSYSQSAPDVSDGRIVWADNRDGDSDVYCYTVATGVTQRITSEPVEQDSPRIGGSTVVWREQGAGGSVIRYATIGSSVELAKPAAPTTARAKVMFSVKGSVTPAHVGSARDIRIVVRKWDAGKKKWSYYGNVLTASSAGANNTLGYSASFSLNKKGRYALQAVHPGCTIAGYGTSGKTIAGWAQVQVK